MQINMTPNGSEPPADCALCPRLLDFRAEMQGAHPDWHNRPVPSFGGDNPSLLIVGLAPGMKGANRTGRPFTGDVAGRLLYPTLVKFGFAQGTYLEDPADGLTLVNCRITNAVRCLPPGNKPTAQEVNTCRDFLAAEISRLPNLQAILALGRIAHGALAAALSTRQSAVPFSHGAIHRIGPLIVADSYHCSQYNVNTGRLTVAMFEGVFADLQDRLRPSR